MSEEVEAGRALLAGFIAGAAAAFATTAIALLSMSRSPQWQVRATGVERVSLPLLGVALVNGLLLGSTLLGLMLGAAYLGVEDRLRFALLVLAAVAVALAAATYVRGRLTAPMWGTALAAALAFGLLLPALAG